MLATTTKEMTIAYLVDVGRKLKVLIDKQIDIDLRINALQEIAIHRLGKMPLIEYIDTDWITAEVSNVLN